MRWRGQSVCIIASGPSLTREDAAYARRHADRVITVNESWRMCPDADAVYGADTLWWQHRAPPLDEFKGERWTQQSQWKTPFPPGVQCFQSKPGTAIAPPGSGFVYTGHNSSFQALGLAVAWGAEYVVFLGLDLSALPDGTNHWHGDHVQPLVNSLTAYPTFIKAFTKAAPVLAELGVYVVNASRRTALEAFPRMTPEEAFAEIRRRKRGIPVRTADPARQAEVDYFFDPDGDGDL